MMGSTYQACDNIDLTYQQYLDTKDKEGYDGMFNYIKSNKHIKADGKIYVPRWDPLIVCPLGIYIELINPPLPKRYVGAKVSMLYVPQLSFPRLYRNLSLAQVYGMSYVNVVAVLNWFSEQLELIADWERRAFGDGVGTKPSKLDKFGIYNLISFITGDDITMEDRVLDIPYRHVLIHAERKLLAQSSIE